MTNSKPRSHESQPLMEGIVYFVAEWISLKEMKALQSSCMLVSKKAREKEYEEFFCLIRTIRCGIKIVRRMAATPDDERKKPSHVIQA